MGDLKNWTEITKGLYRYVIAANVCYELHILYWNHDTDISTAKASAYLVGEWIEKGQCILERESILLEQSVLECLKAVIKDDKENNNHD